MKTSPDPIETALNEDIGKGDLTSEFFVPPNRRVRACIAAHENAIIAGTKTAAEVFQRVEHLGYKSLPPMAPP